MLPLAGAIADTELESGRGESVCRNRNGAAFSHLGSSIGAVEVDCTYFQSFSSRVRWRKTYCALSLSKLCWTGPFPAFFPDRKQVLQSRFWGGCKGNRAFRIPADVFGWRVYLMRIWRMRFWRLWQPGSGLLALLAKPGSALWDFLGRQTRTGWISCHLSNNANAVFAAPEQGTHLGSADQQKRALVHRLDLCSRHVWRWHCPA